MCSVFEVNRSVLIVKAVSTNSPIAQLVEREAVKH